ncbi:uncharacterized protein LOC116302548 [Actinia tenebrosa]|uniref:Uncharacterized protein LOC116302548 n=1 Tax=Actinia tenebrosa TaxID=6105 RepID=A0A6P8ILP6_ACTTE|nr:uncharacterized protein LOC116302548 [Actinia tenebrosa]
MAEKDKKSRFNEPLTHETENRTFAQLHDYHSSNLHPQQEAFVIYDEEGKRRSYTFQDVKEQSLKIAAILLQIGIDKGQSVAFMVPNRIEFILCYLALNRIGANTILIPAHGKTGEDVIAILQRYKCQALLLHPSGDNLFDQRLTENAKTVLGEDRTILIGEEDVGQDPSIEVKYRLNDLLKTSQEINLDEVYKRQEAIHPDEPFVCLFTSGSTGVPKAIQYTHRAMVNLCILFAKHYLGCSSSPHPVENPCRFFNDRPFSWAGCLFIGIHNVFAMGFTLVYCPPTRSVCSSDPEFFIRILQDEKCSGALLLPYLMHDLIANPSTEKFNLSHLKHVITGGQVISKSLLANMMSVLPNCAIINLYAMTEIFPIAAKTIRSDDDVLSKAGMRVCSPAEVKIINDNKEDVGFEEMGEICVRYPYRFREYLEDPKATSIRVDPRGWFHTDDVGYIDHHGGLHACGRMSEVISKMTINIYPIEVEMVLSTYPDVKAVAVIGVPDEREGEEICACVIPKPGSRLESSVTEFEEWSSQQWKTDETGATRKQRYTLVLEAFPLKNTGKTDRKALKALALQKLGMCK